MCLPQVDLLSHLLAAGAHFDYSLFQGTVAEWDSSEGLRADALGDCISSMIVAGKGEMGLQRLSYRGKFLMELAILKPAEKVTQLVGYQCNPLTLALFASAGGAQHRLESAGDRAVPRLAARTRP